MGEGIKQPIDGMGLNWKKQLLEPLMTIKDESMVQTCPDTHSGPIPAIPVGLPVYIYIYKHVLYNVNIVYTYTHTIYIYIHNIYSLYALYAQTCYTNIMRTRTRTHTHSRWSSCIRLPRHRPAAFADRARGGRLGAAAALPSALRVATRLEPSGMFGSTADLIRLGSSGDWAPAGVSFWLFGRKGDSGW